MYPGPQARASNDLHQVDRVGPVYLKGRSHRYYIWVGKDAFDGAVCLRLAGSRRMDEVLWFLGECWKDLGNPEQAQFDNARELCGWGSAARTLSRLIRFCLRFGVGPVFIPKGEPQFNGGVENFNDWFQPRLFDRRYARPGDLLGVGTAAGGSQHAACPPATRGPDAGAASPGPAAAEAAGELRGADRAAEAGGGAVTFIWRVSTAGTVSVLSQSFRVGKRYRGLDLSLVIDTRRGWLTACLNGRVLKRWPYKLRND